MLHYVSFISSFRGNQSDIFTLIINVGSLAFEQPYDKAAANGVTLKDMGFFYTIGLEYHCEYNRYLAS